MRRVALFAAPIAALAALQCACETVPTLTFAQADAALEASEDGQSTSTDGGLDGCADPGTGTRYVCCGTVACAGCTTEQCGTCMSMNRCAQPGYFCCQKTNNIMCQMHGASCR
jgi:hypothetical protein